MDWDIEILDVTNDSREGEIAVQRVRKGIEQFNRETSPDPLAASLTLCSYRNDSVVAGLLGRTLYGWLEVEHLWVDEVLRGRGLGARLLQRAEHIALERGCHSAHLDTYGYQAPEFYRAQGYEVFGELADYPDVPHFFFRKSLA